MARALDLTLTSRDKGKEDAVPMCGVPHHAARGYLGQADRARHQGRHVRADRGSRGRQGDRQARGRPRRHAGRRPRRRGARPERAAAIVAAGRAATGGAASGWPTSTSRPASSPPPSCHAVDGVVDELARVAPREWCSPTASSDRAAATRFARAHPLLARARRSPRAAAAATSSQVPSAPGVDHAALERAPRATARRPPALRYARATQPRRRCRSRGSCSTARSDTWCSTSRRGEPRADRDAARSAARRARCSTSSTRRGPRLGGRLLRRWLLSPLVDVAQIRRRHDAVEWLVERAALRADLRAQLWARSTTSSGWPAGRTLGVATPRDLAALRAFARRSCRRSRRAGRHAPAELRGRPPASRSCSISRRRRSRRWRRSAPRIAARSLVDEPPATHEGRRLHPRAGLRRELDELRDLADGGKDEILAIEARERERTGIASLKVRYNRVFGYYIEITRSQPRPRARRLHAQADARQRRALRHARARRVRGKVLTAEERSRRARGGAVRRAAPEAARPRAPLLALAGRSRRLDALRLARRGRAHRAATAAPRSTTAACSRSTTAAIRWSRQLAAAGQLRAQRLPPRSRRRAARWSSPAPTWPASRRTCGRWR